MILSELLSVFTLHPGVKALKRCLDKGTSPVVLSGLRGSAPAVMLAALTQTKKAIAHPFLIVLDDEEEAGYFYHDLVQLVGEKNALFFPTSYRRAVKYAQRDAANEILRTDVLTRLLSFTHAAEEGAEESAAEGDKLVAQSLFIVSYPAALAERIASQQEMDDVTIHVATGQEHDLIELCRRMEKIGFKRRDYVYEPGEFALRGSILDVFSYSSEYPYRIDFFGDEIDSIRTFEVQTQLSREVLHDITIVPNVETGTDANTPLVPFTDALPKNTVVVSRNLPFVIERIQHIYDEGFAQQAIAEREAEAHATSEMEIAAIHERLTSSFLLTKGEVIVRGLKPLQHFIISNKDEVEAEKLQKGCATVRFNTAVQPLFHKDFEQVLASFQQNLEVGMRTFVLADSDKQNERLSDILDSISQGETAPVAAEETSNPRRRKAAAKKERLFTPVHHTLHEGFSDLDARVALFTDHQIFDRFHKYNLKSDHARNTKMALTLKELMQFQQGDYIVHVDHGIGQFAGLAREVGPDGQMREVIKLNYKNNGSILVSIHSLHKLSKYKGRDGEPPRLSALGTGAWERIKEKTKKKLKDIARDLILLYSRRLEERGHAFSPDNFMQHELEASFAYEDTPDQLKVTQQVKADMERQQPMDRLVCGDVGFGKTEIAIRAAFKTACDNKQVAVLVPTTVLAFQHYRTFKKRLAQFPVRIEYLSRARTTQQTKAILADLAEGKIDIVVGTHKLIGKSVKFKDLGLLIIDEEQKFGVSVKERLRQMKASVDTLTMSATPIPRTLQFSLMGARDLSVISTPPPNRRPIQTEIHTFGHEIIADAINFELSRNGQVYIVTHRINRLDEIAAVIRKHVPDARVVIGHGQMPPTKLEQIVEDFVNHEYDVLLSTTIVENGIDIANANTIIIDNAHHFGLSDLHQMRGRVGRSDRKAFCYLLAPPLSVLPDDSRRRLQAIENFSDLGSGIHIAMQDLDIRGAGNLLGAEQSGFIADLGYETYQKILNEAVTELRNEAPLQLPPLGGESEASEGSKSESARTYGVERGSEPSPYRGEMEGGFFVAECNVDCDLHAYFPETYVPGASERMLLYRELDGLLDDEQIAAFRQRLIDRFGADKNGNLPAEAEELLRVSPLRRLGRRAGAERLTMLNGNMTLYFIQNRMSPFFKTATFGRIIDFAMRPENIRHCTFGDKNGKQYLRFTGITTVAQGVKMLQNMLGDA